MATSYFCSQCHAPRDAADLSAGASRRPCPNCGSTAMTVGQTVHEVTQTTASVSTKLIPADQTRGWRQRFHEAERELQGLLAPRTSPRSAETVNAERDAVHAFYVQTYHIKDALKADAASTGVAGATIENAITAEPALALLADLANLDKHGAWDARRTPRSGSVPVFASHGGTSGHDSQPETWRLEIEIRHAGRTRDGLRVAEDAVTAWRRLLTGWGLI
jgi:hypothetical protein